MWRGGSKNGKRVDRTGDTEIEYIILEEMRVSIVIKYSEKKYTSIIKATRLLL